MTASDSARVYEISLFDDGHIIRNFYVHGGTPTLSGHMVWYGARLLKPRKVQADGEGDRREEQHLHHVNRDRARANAQEALAPEAIAQAR